jgi:hypothetical protein
VIYIYDGDPRCLRRTICGHQEEGEYEYVSDQHGSTESNEEAHVEPAILVQPLVSETHAGEGEQAEVGAVPLCEGGATGACFRDAGGIGIRTERNL